MKTIIKVILFFVFLAMMIMGQKHVGYPGLGVMMLGLIGLLGLLWDYNRKYQ
ncbi:DUF6903 family protein [Enterococcus sp. HY326]|uniref:DUF6903 family protein n=1 Tax=Enterococcus sp. HY326 TaxID=2971265 RepID=UPI00223F92DF|nr:hypothetical protein [Enterococcus sp. HY326]